MLENHKHFLILGNMNNVTSKSVSPNFIEGKIWYGSSISSGAVKFHVPDNYQLNASICGIDESGRKFIFVKGIRWFTNFVPRKVAHHIISALYDPQIHKKYENYDAINVNKLKDIPKDYAGWMGVPITILDKYSPDQFEMLLLANGNTQTSYSSDLLKIVGYQKHPKDRGGGGVVDGELVYARVMIRHKNLP